MRVLGLGLYCRHFKLKAELQSLTWKIRWEELRERAFRRGADRSMRLASSPNCNTNAVRHSKSPHTRPDPTRPDPVPLPIARLSQLFVALDSFVAHCEHLNSIRLLSMRCDFTAVLYCTQYCILCSICHTTSIQ